jgi:monoterpene epsilon-lactone hydrolase
MNVHTASQRSLRMIATGVLASGFALAQLGSARAETPDAQAATIDAEGQMHLPPRTIPLPSTVSPDAQKFLTTGIDASPAPPVADKAAWHAAIAQFDKSVAERTESVRSAFTGKIDGRDLGGVKVYDIIPQGIPPRHTNRVLIYLHPGSYVFGAGVAGIAGAVTLAAAGPFHVYSVDYRMAPDHPYPAALDDTVAVYREVIKRFEPTSIGIVGVSSGGGLAAATVLKLRDAGVPLPGAVVLLAPQADLTESGDTIQTNRDLDVVLRHPVPEAIALYAGGNDLKDPYLSPLYGDFAKGYCPTFLQSGTRDMMLSDTVRLHRALRRAGVDAELHVFEAMPHIGFSGAPEDEELQAEELRFLDKHLGRY